MEINIEKINVKLSIDEFNKIFNSDIIKKTTDIKIENKGDKALNTIEEYEKIIKEF